MQNKEENRWGFYAAAVILVFVLLHGYMFSEFKQIPGPRYGGDFYMHYGIVKHIYNGNMPWTCPQVLGEYAFYPWLFHLIVAVFGWITGDLLKSYIFYVPVIITALCGVIVYFLGKELFEDIKYAVLLTLAWLGLRLYVGYIPSHFTPTITLPLFFYTVFKAYKTKTFKWASIAGISFGLLNLSHASALPAGGFLLILLFIYSILKDRIEIGFNAQTSQWNIKTNTAKLSETIKEQTKIVAPILIIGLIIGLIYWGPILLIYRFQIKNPWNEFTQPDYAVYGGEIALTVLKTYFFNIDALSNIYSAHRFTASILTAAGLILAIKERRNPSASFILTAFAAGFIGYFHYLVTTPLLHTSFVPGRFETFMLNPAAFLLGIYAIYSLNQKIKSEKNRKTFYAAAATYFVIVSAINYMNMYNGTWTQVGRADPDDKMQKIQEWVEKNTDKNAVFISHDELAFALNGLTGRKIVTERRTHYNPYVDMNERLADSAIILYGNNSEKTLELLKKYNISYLYWDINWLYDQNNQGGFAYREPLLTLPKYADYLKEYGVNYTRTKTYLDPAWVENYPKYDMLAVVPATTDVFAPWSKTLAKHLKVETEVTVQTQTRDGKITTIPVYRIYSIDYSSF